MADNNKTNKTSSPNQETNIKKMALDGCGKWITRSIQPTILFRWLSILLQGKMLWEVTSWLQLEIGS
jgi:hypothetical protein